jgi:hypothetical protein
MPSGILCDRFTSADVFAGFLAARMKALDECSDTALDRIPILLEWHRAFD